jgi:metallophosphoesterase (TIGR00282 family)
MLNVLMAGDVVGESGRQAVALLLPNLRQEYKLDLVVVNGENADGLGLYISSMQELFEAGADVMTLGDHIYDKSEIYNYLAQEPRAVRPLNFNSYTPGSDRVLLEVRGVKVMVVSVIGLLKINMYAAASPFAAMEQLLDDLALEPASEKPQVVLVDFHAEEIKEKQALAWYLDGKVSVVVGTHTHVPTADLRILPKGTARVTDLGMCGPRDGSLGMSLVPALTRFVDGLPSMYEVATGPVQFNSVFFQIDEATGKCVHVERVDRVVEIDGQVHNLPKHHAHELPTARTDSQALT